MRLSDKVWREGFDAQDFPWTYSHYGQYRYNATALVHSQRTAFVTGSVLAVYDSDFSPSSTLEFEGPVVSVLELEDLRVVVSSLGKDKNYEGCLQVFSADLQTVLHRRDFENESYSLILPYRNGVLAFRRFLKWIGYLDFTDPLRDEVVGNMFGPARPAWLEDENVWIFDAPTFHCFSRHSGSWTMRSFEPPVMALLESVAVSATRQRKNSRQEICFFRLRSGVFVYSRICQDRIDLIVWELNGRVVADKLATGFWSHRIWKNEQEFTTAVEDDQDPRAFFFVGKQTSLRIRVRVPSDSLLDRCAAAIACYFPKQISLLKDALPAELVELCVAYACPGSDNKDPCSL